MHVIDVMAMAMEEMDIVFCDEGKNESVRSNGDGDGSDGHCYRVEALVHVIDVMVMVIEVMDIVIRLKLYCM